MCDKCQGEGVVIANVGFGFLFELCSCKKQNESPLLEGDEHVKHQ